MNEIWGRREGELFLSVLEKILQLSGGEALLSTSAVDQRH